VGFNSRNRIPKNCAEAEAGPQVGGLEAGLEVLGSDSDSRTRLFLVKRAV